MFHSSLAYGGLQQPLTGSLFADGLALTHDPAAGPDVLALEPQAGARGFLFDNQSLAPLMVASDVGGPRTIASGLAWVDLAGADVDTLFAALLAYLEMHTDHQGMRWVFAASGTDAWVAPPERFQTVARLADDYVMTFPDGLKQTYDAATGRLETVEDLNSNTVTLTYDGVGKLTRVAGTGDASGPFIDLAYDAAGHWSSLTDSAGRQVLFTWDSEGDLVQETDVLGHSKTYLYDGGHRLVEKTDYRGNLYQIAYDARSRVVRIVDPLEGVTSLSYDLENRRTLLVDRRGHGTLRQMDPLGNPTRTVDPLGNEQAMTYDADGNRLSVADARGNLSTASYDSSGRRLSSTNPLGETTSWTYDGSGRVLTETDALDEVTTHVYDANGNRTQTTDPAGHVTTYAYDASGQPTSITRPGAATTLIAYDPRGLPTTMTDPEGHATGLTFNAAGHLTGMTDGNGATWALEVDAKGRMTKVTDGLGHETAMAYDLDGNRVSMTDALQKTTTSAFDALSRQVGTVDALNQARQTEYDAEGNVTAAVDARGFRTELSYDAVGRLAAVRDASGAVTSMGYCAGQAAQACIAVDPLGQMTLRDEDELGRITAETNALGHATLTGYDALGRVASMTDALGHVTQYGYDALGRLATVTDALSGVTQYQYDARGNRVALTDANNQTTTFDYDKSDRLIRETTPIGTVTEFTYDGVGNRLTKLDGKGQTTAYAYDAARRLTQTTYHDASVATFVYDARGSRVSESNVDSTRFRTYDELGRLATVLDVETGRTITYGYDANGMRASMLVTPDNELTTYQWDGRGKLVKMTDPDGDDYFFAYDAAGRRVVQTYPNGMVLTQAHDAAGQILAMVYQHPTGGVLKSFGYKYDARGNREWKMFETGGAELYQYDALSRLTRATYPSGRDVEYVYDPVGNRLVMHERELVVPDPCVDDLDCDGVLDADDNCPSYVNPAQADSDAAAINVHGGRAVWPFEGTGAVVEDRLDAFAGTFGAGVTRSTAGKFGAGLDIASGGTVAFDAGVVDGLGAFTLSGWVKTSDADATVFQASNGTEPNELHLRTIPPTGAPRIDIKGAGFLLSGASVVDDAWHHLAIARDEVGEVTWWLDGVGHAGGSVSALPLDADSVTLGSGSDGYEGALDEWSVYPRVLSEDEIDRLYALGLLGDGVGDVCDACPLEGDPGCQATQCLDSDGDGYGQVGLTACSGGGLVDCDDTDPTVHPGVSATCQARVATDVESVTYTYNGFNQLVDATSSASGVTTFVFDGNGNRTTTDATGAGGGVTAFAWDVRDRLVQLTTAAGVSNTFGYDVENLRVRVSDSAGDRRILLDGIEEYAEYEVVGQTEEARYDHDPSGVDRLLAQETSADGKHQFVTDALGSVYGLAAGDASVASSYDYDAYGAREAVGEDVVTTWAFQGRPVAAAGGDTAPHYHRERYYDPLGQVWLSSDPKDGDGGIHLYAFCRNSPVTRVDPEGTSSVTRATVSFARAYEAGFLTALELLQLLRMLLAVATFVTIAEDGCRLRWKRCSLVGWQKILEWEVDIPGGRLIDRICKYMCADYSTVQIPGDAHYGCQEVIWVPYFM